MNKHTRTILEVPNGDAHCMAMHTNGDGHLSFYIKKFVGSRM